MNTNAPHAPKADGRVSHLMRVSDAARLLGVSTKRFINAANARELGTVELLPLGDETFVRARSLLDFIDGAPGAVAAVQHSSSADEPDDDLFAAASTAGGV